MDINKTDMFEKFFNGFQEKFIESFKEAGEEKILVRILENQKASKEEYRTYFNCAWEFLEKTTIAHQQAKVEGLQVQLKGTEERAQLILQYKEKYRKERDELQKRVAAISEVLDELQEQADVIRKRGQKFRDSNFLASADMMDICIKEIEQALKGEGTPKNIPDIYGRCDPKPDPLKLSEDGE